MEIGDPEKTIEIIPSEEPVPREEPAPKAPRERDPDLVPA